MFLKVLIYFTFAFPLFFLDYYGTAHLNTREVTNFVKGLSEACIENGHIPLIGGETAEMPSIYIEGKTDLVGCIIGLKDERFFQNTQISSGDVLIGIPSEPDTSEVEDVMVKLDTPAFSYNM